MLHLRAVSRLLFVALVAIALTAQSLWSPPSAQAAEDGQQTPAAPVVLAASKAGDDWSDANGVVGKAQLTYGHVGCSAVDSNNQCIEGVWPKVTGAEWIWATKDWSPSRMETTFTKTFQASAGPGVLHLSADNIVVALLNGNEVARDVGYNGVRDVSLTLANGENTLVLVVRNFEDSADPSSNPAGVAWSIEGPPFVPGVVADAGPDQTVPEGMTVRLDGTKSSATTTTPINEGGGTAVTGLGGQIFSTGGPVEVQVLPASAGITSELWLFEPVAKRIATNRDENQTFQIGTFPAGAELVFGIKYGDTEFRMGPGERNPDGIPHAVVEELNTGRLRAGFEDLFGGGDHDYDDNLFEFRGGIATEPPTATYHWELLDAQGPPVQLSSYTDLQPVFDAVENGTYTFRLTVAAGDVIKTDDVTINVTNVAPQVGAAAAPTTNDGMVMVTSQITDAGILDVHTADVAWGDGTTTTGVKAAAQGAGWAQASAAHVYNTANTYTITVTMKDDDGGSTVTTTSVVVGGTGVPKPISGLALWADNAAKGITVTGSNTYVEGLTHANGSLSVGGTKNSFKGTTEYGTTLSKGGGNTFSPAAVKTGTKQRPVNLPLVDYQPSGRAARAAGSKYFDMTSACTAGKGKWQPKNVLKPGLYYAPCDVQINGGNYASGGVTIAASGTIVVTCGSRDNFKPFVDQALFISGSTSASAIRIDGSSSTFSGFILANSGGVDIAGADNTFICAIVANEIKITGAKNAFDTMSCGGSCTITNTTGSLSDGTDVAGSPLLVPNLQTAATGPATSLPGATLDVRATARNDGATLVVPGLVAMANGSTGTRTMNSAIYELEVADAAGTWTTLATTANGTAALSALGAPTTGATYGANGDIAGTRITQNNAGVWATTAIIKLSSAQIQQLLDPARTSSIRSRLTVSPDSTTSVRQTSRFGTNIVDALHAMSADITNVNTSLINANGIAGPQNLGTIAQGASAMAAFAPKAPAIAPKGATETDAAYTARLLQLDNSTFGALAKTSGRSFAGALYAPAQSVNTAVNVPILSPASADLAPVSPGAHVAWTVDVSNMGRAQATGITVAATANSATANVTEAPALLNSSARALVTASFDVPSNFTNPFMNVAMTVNWKDAGGNVYGPVTLTKTLRVVQPAALRVLKGVTAVDNSTITYTVSATNSGDSAVNNVVITDTPDANTRIVAGSVTSTTGTATNNNGTIVVTAGDLAGRAAVFVTYKVDYTTLPAGVTSVTNQATVTSANIPPTLSDDPNVGGPADPTVFTFAAPPNGNNGGSGNADPSAPKATNITPIDGTTITAATAITAGVAPVTGRAITQWSVLAYPAGDNVAIAKTLASGNGAPPATLATLDPTLLNNGMWILRIVATDSTGVTGFTESSVIIGGDMKLGRYSVSYNDLRIPVGGIPIDIERSYDSIDRNHVGDFGNGWNAGLANFRIQTNRPLGLGGWERYSCGSGLIFVPLCYKTTTPHIVTVTWPDGHIEQFDFTPKGGTTFFPMQATAAYSPRVGARNVTSTLTPAPGDESAGAPNPTDGNIYEGGFADGGIYNPTRFVLTDKSGTKYLLDANTGLVETTDRTGNRVTIDDAGVHSSNGVDVAFVRDSLGRITKVDGPGVQDMTYGYSVAGDLTSVTNAEGARSSYAYDASHNITSSTDFAGHPSRSMTYDTNGRLSSITDANGNTVTVSSNVSGRSQTVTDPLGKLTTISTYNDTGDLLREDKIHDSRTDTTTFAYDAGGRRTSVTDPLGRVLRGTYDTKGNLLTVTDPKGATLTMTYGDHGETLSIRDAVGNTTSFTYDDSGNLIKTTDPLNRSSQYSYGANGRVSTQTNPLGHVTSFTYDSAGRVLTQVNARNATTTYTYDAAGNRTSEKDAVGNIIRYEYDALGNMTKSINARGAVTGWAYDANGRRISETNALGKTRTYGYDGEGNLISVKDANGFVTTNTYDKAGNLVKAVDGAGRTTTYAYDGLGRRISTTDGMSRTTRSTYDAASQLTSTVEPSGATETRTYDLAGNLATIRDALGNTTTYGCDAMSRLTSVTDPRGGRTTYTLDALGFKTAETDATGGRVTFEVDALGQPTAITDAMSRKRTMSYDAAGNLVTEVDPAMGTTRYVFDLADRMTAKTDARNIAVNYDYDAASNRTTASYPGGQVSQAFDLLNRRTSMNDSSGVANFSWDGESNLLSASTPAGTTTYAYDGAGNRSSMNLAGRTIAYGYDAAGEVTSINDGSSGVNAFGYDANGNLATTVRPNGITTTNTYDAAGRLTGIRHATASATIDNIRYTLDANGNRTAKASNRGNESYVVDNLNRLTRATYANGNVTTYAYNAAGDRTSNTINGTTTSFTYDAGGRLTANGSTTFAYDAAGNIARAGTSNYTWDWNNRLTQVTNGSSVTNYGYDGDDLRVSAGTARYAWDRSSGVPALLADGTNTYVPGINDEALETVSSTGAKTWTLNDALGSVEYVTNATAQTVGSRSYDVFGGVRSTTGAGSVFGFTGALTDATALPYLRARTLDVSRGRFLSADTVQPNAFGTQGWNRYSYAANAPTTLTDPSGHSVFGEYSTLTGRQIVAFSAVGASATCLAIPACSAAMTEASYGLTNGIVGGFSTVADKLSGVHLAVGEPVLPPATLPAFPNAKRAREKTPVQGGGMLRKRWKDPDGTIYEWDYKRGKVEVYNKRGKHQGEYDPNSGEQTKPAEPGRKVDP